MTAKANPLAVIDNFIDPETYPHQEADLTEARAYVERLVEAAELAKAALLTGQVGHINRDDVAVYHLDGGCCGYALNKLRDALAPFKAK